MMAQAKSNRQLVRATRPVFDQLETRQHLANTTYYVAPWGNDNNPGTAENAAWQSLSKINRSTFGPGDRILLAGGQTFNGTLEITEDDRGEANNLLTVSSYGNGRATIQSTGGKGLLVRSAPGVSVSNLNIRGTGVDNNQAQGLHFQNNLGRDIGPARISNVDVSGFGMFGITVQGTQGSNGWRDVRITDSSVHGNGYAGIRLLGTDGIRDTNNDVYIARVRAFDNPGFGWTNSPTGSGIQISSSQNVVVEYSSAYNNSTRGSGATGIWASQSDRVTFQYNSSYNNRARGSDGGGFDLDGGITNSVMQYNYSANNDGAGFATLSWPGAPANSNIVIRYNISQNDARKNGAGGIAVGANNGSFRDIYIHNNTVYMKPAAVGDSRLIWTHYYVSNLQIKNNIFYADGNVNFARFRDNPDLKLSHNVWFTNGQSKFEHNGWYNNVADWQRGTGSEIVWGVNTAITRAPRLANIGHAPVAIEPDRLDDTLIRFYTLRRGSPLLNRGTEVPMVTASGFGAGSTSSATQDFFGNAVKLDGRNRVDIGAHERG
jgi:Right handed beta helix region